MLELVEKIDINKVDETIEIGLDNILSGIDTIARQLMELKEFTESITLKDIKEDHKDLESKRYMAADILDAAGDLECMAKDIYWLTDNRIKYYFNKEGVK